MRGRAIIRAPVEKTTVERSLDASIKDGTSYAVMAGLGDPGYVGACALLLGASPSAVAILVTVPVFLGALAQLFLPALIELGVRRKLLLVGGALCQAFSWLPMLLAATPYCPAGWNYPLLFGGFCLHFVSLSATVAPWTSIMGELVPSAVRGRFFGYRSSLALLLQFAALVVSGTGLELFRRRNHEKLGFAVVFAGALLARLQSTWFLSRMADPPHVVREQDRFTLAQFLARLPRSNFAKFVFFVAALSASAHFAGCLFIPYWRETLHYSYWGLMAVAGAVVGVQVFTLPFWGRQADRYGNKKIMVVSSFGIAILPALWLLHTHLAWAVFLQLWSGFFWSGFNQAAANFLLDAVTPPKRARCAAYLGLFTNCGLLLGGLAGSWAITHLPTSFAGYSWPHRFWTLLGISFLLRSLTIAFFLPRIREVRDVPPIGVGQMMIQAAREVTGSTLNLFSLMSGRTKDEDEDEETMEGPK
jgi:MFS family permease